MIGLLALLAAACAPARAADEPEVDPVVQAMRQTGGGGSVDAVCAMLARASEEPADEAAQNARADAIKKLRTMMSRGDIKLRRARADATLGGLYGYQQDADRAYRMYSQIKSPEAGWNAAMLLYQRTDIRSSPEDARNVMHLMERAGALEPKSRGPSSGPANYLAGLIAEHGWDGEIRRGDAFKYYRIASIRNYVPAIPRYLTLIMDALPLLTEPEQKRYLHDVRYLSNRWRWTSPAVMAIRGNLYAMDGTESNNGAYLARYHWSLAQHMAQGTEEVSLPIAGNVASLSDKDAKRLDEAVESALKRADVQTYPFELELICS